MTTQKIYRNVKNPHKYLDVRYDGYGHQSVVQFMHFSGVESASGKPLDVRNGDQRLHRWRKANLGVLLEDYDELKEYAGMRFVWHKTGKMTGRYTLRRVQGETI